jgi:hypothetical protein
MIFIDNKYTTTYYNIIERAQSRTKSLDCYTEKHHIIPKSLDGGNDKCNLVVVTAKEHYILHCLLIKMVAGNQKAKMVYALHAMQFFHQDKRYTSKMFEYYRPLWNEAKSKSQTGNKNHFYGKTHSSYAKKVMSDKAKLRTHTSETKEKIGRINLGKKHSNESIIKQRKIWAGRDNTVTCPHCKKTGAEPPMKRWHFDNCKK